MAGYATQRHFKLQHPILQAEYCGSHVFVVDNRSVLYVFDENYNLINKLKLNKKDEQKHCFDQSYSIAAKKVAIPMHNQLIWASYGKEGKLVPRAKKSEHDKEIIHTQYCPAGNYLISAGIDGKAFLFDIQSKSIRYMFKNKPDFCSVAQFSPDGNFAFVAYFNTENALLNLNDDSLHQFKLDYPVEQCRFFDDGQKLFLTDREGNSIIYDCIEHQVVHNDVLFDQWVSATVLAPSKRFIIAGSRKNKIYLLDPFKNEVVKTVELEDKGVTSMSVYEDLLLITFANSTLQVIDMAHKREDFLVHLNLKEYDRAKELLDLNSFLFVDDNITKFQNGFEEVLVKAKELIAKGEIQTALELVNPFMDYREYKESLDLLFMQQDHIASFVEAVEKKDIAKAYQLVSKYPMIKSLSLYQNLEKMWEKSFAKARKVLEEDELRGRKKASEILSVYENIPQKAELVRQLLSNIEKFRVADRYIKEQNFKAYFQLVSKYEFLQDTRLYKRVENLAESMYKTAQSELAKQHYERAKQNFINLLYFPMYKKEAQAQIQKIQALVKLEQAIEANDSSYVYELVAKYRFLAFTDRFKEFNKPFEQKLQQAAFHAQCGKMKMAIKQIEPYIKVVSLREKLDNCIKIGYLKQIENADFSTLDHEMLIGKYKTLFGLDENIEEIFKKNKKTDIFNKAKQAGKRYEITRYPVSLV